MWVPTSTTKYTIQGQIETFLRGLLQSLTDGVNVRVIVTYSLNNYHRDVEISD